MGRQITTLGLWLYRTDFLTSFLKLFTSSSNFTILSRISFFLFLRRRFFHSLFSNEFQFNVFWLIFLHEKISLKIEREARRKAKETSNKKY